MGSAVPERNQLEVAAFARRGLGVVPHAKLEPALLALAPLRAGRETHGRMRDRIRSALTVSIRILDSVPLRNRVKGYSAK
jgi:hypothetical protein